MGYDRNPRGNDQQRDPYGYRDRHDDDRGDRIARSYGAGGDFDRDRGRDRDDYGQGYGQSGYDRSGSSQRGYAQTGYGQSGQTSDDRYGAYDRGSAYGAHDRGDNDRPAYGRQDGDRGQFGGGYGARDAGRGYSSGAHRPEARYRDDGRQAGYGRQPQGYDYDDRGFLARAGDEVRSWFGDEDAERRREADSRYDERYYSQQGRHDRDSDYGSWRSSQIAALDRDYDEYRQENRSRFESEFATWRSNRQTQRQSLDQVKEHAEVLGSDGSHVGTVDKVRGDRILLTKNDRDADGHHHSIPSSWLRSVEDGKVTLSKTADEAKRQWRDEEQNQALFRYGEGKRSGVTQGGATNLNRSFSGTYDEKK